MVGLSIISALILMALLGPCFVPHDPLEINLENRLSPPSRTHLMGTDDVGRDILSRVVHGTRVSLILAVTVVALSFLIGTIIGTTAGYFGGMVDEFLMRLVDLLLAFPGLIIALLVVGFLGTSLRNVIIALVVRGWVEYARVMRGIVLSVKERRFIEASKALGCRNSYILARHILPNSMTPMVALAALEVGHTILSIATLSFLGLGVQPPTPEWGAMLNSGKPFMESAPYLMIFPGLMIMIAVLAFNLLGDGLQEILDPRAREVVDI